MKIENKHMTLNHVESERQAADFSTKPISQHTVLLLQHQLAEDWTT